MTRQFMVALFAVAVLGAGASGMDDPSAQTPRPHIVLMMADDLGWGDVGYHGSRIETPNIDALADRGARLEQFYVQPVCSPTRGALMTGRYPMRLGLQVGVVRPWADYGLPVDERTLADALGSAGYRTAIVGKWHLGHARAELLPTRRGFDRQYGHYNGALNYWTHERDGGHDWNRDDRPNFDEGYTTHLLADEASAIIAGHDQEVPLFLYVPFNAPHSPFQAPEEAIARYESIKNERRRIYAAMVSEMDAAVGRIVGALAEAGFPEARTFVFFCSDNGGVTANGSNGPLRDGKGSLYEGGVRVPALAVWPGVIEPGSVVDEPLHVVDLYPTLVGMAGGTLEQPKPIDGRDALASIASGGPSPHRGGFILHNLAPNQAAIRSGDWKLIRNGGIKANDAETPAEATFELFRIDRDPEERHDVAAEHPEVVARLRAELDRLETEAAMPKIAGNRPPDGFQVPELWGHPNLDGAPTAEADRDPAL